MSKPYLRRRLEEYCKEEELGKERTDLRNLGSKETKRRPVWKRRGGVIKKLKVCQKQYPRKGTQKLNDMEPVQARIWRHKALGVCPGPQHQEACSGNVGTEENCFLDVFSEVENVELEHELVFSATFFCVKPRRECKWNKDMHEAWKR